MNTDFITMKPRGPVHAEITPPGSKSITNRALAIAAVAEGESVLCGALDSEDTQVMMDSLRRMGVAFSHDTKEAVIHVQGTGGKLNSPPPEGCPKGGVVIPLPRRGGGAADGVVRAYREEAAKPPRPNGHPSEGGEFHHPVGCLEGNYELFCANSGTTLRFLTAMVSIFDGDFLLDGTERMRQRPIGDMLRAMTQLGVDIISVNADDCPPVLVRAAGLKGGIATIVGNISSQFLSGLLMAAPYAKSPTLLRVTGNLVSRPYVEMTLAVMESFGAEAFSVDMTHETGSCACCGEEKVTMEFLVPGGQKYAGREYVIEPDASAASYFFAAAAVAGGEITVRNLSKNSLQGDVGFCECLAKMGCDVIYGDDFIRVRRDPAAPLHGVDIDMHHISDTAQTLGVTALFADSPTTIRNVANMRVKETDRIHALVTELRKFGVQAEEYPDGLKIFPLSESAENTEPVHIKTWNDHRMAMSFAVAGLRRPNVVIHDPGCTAKTYPRFFEDLEGLG